MTKQQNMNEFNFALFNALELMRKSPDPVIQSHVAKLERVIKKRNVTVGEIVTAGEECMAYLATKSA